jgi:hypothetical protein
MASKEISVKTACVQLPAAQSPSSIASRPRVLSVTAERRQALLRSDAHVAYLARLRLRPTRHDASVKPDTTPITQAKLVAWLRERTLVVRADHAGLRPWKTCSITIVKVPNGDRFFITLPNTTQSPGFADNRHRLWHVMRSPRCACTVAECMDNLCIRGVVQRDGPFIWVRRPHRGS